MINGHRIISAILVALLTVACSPGLIKGQSIDSLLYLIDNDLVKDDSDKYDLLCQVIEDINDTESKIRYCDQAIELAQKLDSLPALPYLMKGDAYIYVGKLPLALECFIQAAKYYEIDGDNLGLGTAYNYMAITYNKQGNRENEQQYLQKAIDIYEQEKDSIKLAYALHNLAYLNYSMEKYDSALFFYSLTGDLFKKLNDNFAYAYCLGNSGLVHSRLSDINKAEEYLLTAMDTLAKLGDEIAVPEFMIEYANILRQKGEIKQAITYASKALINTDDPVYKRDAANLLARLYKISGRFDSAYYYQSIFIVTNDSIKNIESVQKMANLRTEYEVGKKQAEVDVLEKNKLINTIIIIGLGIILILAIGLVSLYYVNLKRSRKLTGTLEERQVLLEKQSSELNEKNDRIIRVNEELNQQKDRLQEQKEELQITFENLKTTQSQLIQSEKMASIGQLVAGIAHEINNPVTFISAGVDSLNTNLEEVRQVLDIYHKITPVNAEEKLKEIENLKEKIEYKETIREINKLIDSVKTGTERTTEIVKGLRTFSRLDEDALKIADIHEGLDSTLILLRNKYKDRIEIKKRYGDVPEIECYPGQLNQGFMNILSNAIDAIVDKGTITIVTTKSNGSIRIGIKDSGRGIPEDIQSRIFEPFFTTKEIGKGTGLGLSITHSIIEKHNGNIEVKSKARQGTEFVIVLPVTQSKR
jgi:signal transduction histidine kinase